jgi:O-methyltransferase involved in polyketide biosynthesis
MTMPFDTTRPNMARMYDYWLGGKDNFEADRKAAQAVREVRPQVAEQAFDNKKFQTRAVSYVAGQGVRQFVDIGSGLPTSPVQAAGGTPLWLATHEAARAIIPDALVAYVDIDEVAVRHSQALLAGGSRQVVAVAGDVHDPLAIFGNDEIRGAGFDPTAPACVVLACILHFVDAQTARGIVATLTEALAPGSYVVISVGFAPGQSGREFANAYNAQSGPRIYSHSWEEITAMFGGLELVPPGLATAPAWRPGQGQTAPPEQASIVAGLGRKA